jgi:hypothetical protein
MNPTTTNDEYVPTWARDNGEIPETPRSEQYGSGVGFHDADQTDDTETQQADETDDNTDETDGVEYTKPDPETPAWVDDTVAVTKGDVTPSCGHPLSDRAIPHVNEARAVYQLPRFPHESAYYQLLDRHDLKFAGERTEDDLVGDTTTDKGCWATRDGLTVTTDNYHNEDGRPPKASYLTVEGPTEDVADFVVDLLDLAYRIKRELRPPAETTDAERNGNRADADDLDRIVGREHNVGVIAGVTEETV